MKSFLKKMKEFESFVKSGYPALWVETHEESRAISVLSGQLPDYNIYRWDVVRGLMFPDGKFDEDYADDPLAPLVRALPSLPADSLLWLHDYHKFLTDISVIRAVKNVLPMCEGQSKHLCFVSPVIEIPIELSKDITIYSFGLPSTDELMTTTQNLVTDNSLQVSINPETIEASRGLTIGEMKNAVSRSIVTTGEITRQILESEKLQAVKKSGLMELFSPRPISELGGLGTLKQYLNARKAGFHAENILARPKGILLVGLPGAGKSLSAKVVSSVFEMPGIRLDIGSLKGSLVGQSEKNMREATKLIDAVSPCVVWMDEIDKAFGGVASSDRVDGGTSSGIFGQFLTWYEESRSTKYIIASCNDIGSLLAISQGALLRRFDDVFFVDVPCLSERQQILEIMNSRYGTSIGSDICEKLEGYTGAEIEKIVRSSLYDGLDQAMAMVKPISEQNKDVIDKARRWASHNARIANTPREWSEENPGERKIKG